MNIYFNPFPTLHSERLFLRQVVESDVQEVFELRSDTANRKYISRSVQETRQYAIDHIRKIEKDIKTNKSINWAITLKGHDKLIGLIGFVRIQPKNFRAEVGYVLSADHRGKGIMDEALKVVLNYGFHVLYLNSVIAVTEPMNYPSEKLLLKNNFVKEAHLRENIFFNGMFFDTTVYSLLKRNHTS